MPTSATMGATQQAPGPATPEGLAFATQVFRMAKPGYHPITTASVDAVLAKAQAAQDQ